jgi:hypothetical protein
MAAQQRAERLERGGVVRHHGSDRTQ